MPRDQPTPGGTAVAPARRVNTVFGVFNIRPGTIDAACMSPAFKRPDLDHLLSRLREHLSAGRRVLFLDVGADIGTYAVSVVNSLRRLGDIRAVGFEPSRSFCKLLRRNLRDNDLDTLVTSPQLAPGDGSTTRADLRLDPREPCGSGLNSSQCAGNRAREGACLDDRRGNRSLVGAGHPCPQAGRRGQQNPRSRRCPGNTGRRARGAAADGGLCRRQRGVRYLEETGWLFDDKLTLYNSFWSIHRRDS